jgi:ribosomal protein S18 acetylase RimI-like enzyme
MAAAAPLQIRPFQPADSSQVLALAPRLTEGVAPRRDPAAVRRAAQNWVQTSIDAAAKPGHAVYVAIARGRVVGVVSIREQAHFTGQVDAYVGELAVASGMTRRGIATGLMNAAEAWAAERGLAFLALHTGAANQPARSLYRRLGYHEEELLLTKAIPARHKHPSRQCHNRQLCAARHEELVIYMQRRVGDRRRGATLSPSRAVICTAWRLTCDIRRSAPVWPWCRSGHGRAYLDVRRCHTQGAGLRARGTGELVARWCGSEG